MGVADYLDLLRTASRRAESSVLLTAPFIKRSVLTMLLEEIPDSKPLKIVTRWIPEEIINGVSDPDIWLDVRDRSGSQLYLVQSLHAKLYLFDRKGWVGSANLTKAALMETSGSNIEVLVDTDSRVPEIARLLEAVTRLQVPVTEELYERYGRYLDFRQPASHLEGKDDIFGPAWLPESRWPEDLYEVACGGHAVTSYSAAPCIRDLTCLGMARFVGERAEFEARISDLLVSTSLVNRVYEFVVVPRRFGELRDWVAREFLVSEDIDLKVQGLFRWLLYFLPGMFNYARPGHSEILSRA